MVTKRRVKEGERERAHKSLTAAAFCQKSRPQNHKNYNRVPGNCRSERERLELNALKNILCVYDSIFKLQLSDE